MKLLYLIQLPKKSKRSRTNEFHTSFLHKYDQCDGCEFLDESIHMNDGPFADTELGNY